jgi:hypothetical protein
MEPTIGRIVHYRLSAEDAKAINRRRTNGASIGDRLAIVPPLWPAGAQAHIGNVATEGDVVPMMIVRTWHTPGQYMSGTSCLNGQAFLDGTDVLWTLSVAEGAGPRTWFWPERA